MCRKEVCYKRVSDVTLMDYRTVMYSLQNKKAVF
jgi:hypothetical protein